MTRLRAIPGYAALFAGAFPGQADPITPESWGQAVGAACHAGHAIGGAMYQKFGITEEYWKATGSTTVDKRSS